MQIGDKIQVVGTVRDIVDESVLMVTEESMHQREYWFLAKHVTVLEEAPAVPGTEPGKPGKPIEPPAPGGHPIEPGNDKPAHPAHPIEPPAHGKPTHPIEDEPEHKKHK